MKHLFRSFLVIAAMVGLALPTHAALYIDDFWSDGTRTDPAAPVYSENGTDADGDGSIESAWFTSSSGSLVAAISNMTLSVGSSAVVGLTYFTSNSPAQLAVGDTLAATFHLTFNNVPASNNSQGFRIGIFDFADSTLSPKRVTSDGSISGNNTLGNGVNGYALFQNMGTAFNSTSPTDIRKRTLISDSRLLGTSSDWTSQGTGPGSTNGFGGFANGINYTLQITLQRTGSNSMSVTASWLNPTNSASLTTTVTDSLATNFNFDSIALRPQDNSSSAGTIIFTEARVELIPGATPPSISRDPQDESVFVGQDASFSVLAAGTLPLSYQWDDNTNSPIGNATNSTLTVTNAQVSDSGGYSVIVSNAYGSVTSAVAQLSVTIPDPPSIITQPQDQPNVVPGASATFTVEAGGSEPLSYQWYYNTTTPVTNANDSTLTLTNVQPGDAGSYSVVVSNIAGSITSSNAVLTVNTNPVAPVFTSQPVSQVVVAGGTAGFSAAASGTQPLSYQWSKDNVPIVGAMSSTLTLTNVQLSAAGNYTVTASNSVGVATSDAAQLTVTPTIPVPLSAYNLIGFGQGTTGGGVLPDTDPNYAKVFTATDLANALNSKTVKVIEIMNDLKLGYNEIEATAKSGSEPFRADSTPLLHPVLLTTGVSLIDIQKKNGLTIFSATGSTIGHAHLNIKASSNIIVRNLRFDELWEWDEATKGNYDKNNWDFMTIGDAGSVTSLWIDHCTFTKSYDGIVDIKNGSAGITLSWCKYTGDDGATNTNSWVWQQINALEANKSSYAMYNSLRSSSGFSTTDIVTIIQGHDKTHLIGANDMDPNNALHTVTLHHEWFINPWDRLPRLRAGNVHDYNIYVDDTVGLAAKRLRDSHTVNSSYSFKPFLNGTISTEDGATLVEKSVYIDCLTPLRNNQTDPSNPAYTGKIEALDCIYHFDNADHTTTDFRGNSTNAPGSTYFGPAQAPIIAFSWNLAGNHLPYTYYPDDPAQLQAIVTSPTAGAGAGVLTWNKTNWLVTSYAPTAPVIASCPSSVTATTGQNVSFFAFAGGSAPVTYQWYFNTTSAIANATNATLSLTSVQAANAGAYSVIVSNVAGTATCSATLGISSPLTAFQSWQMQYFHCTNNGSICAQAAPDADPYGKGISNTNQFLLGLNPTDPASVFRILSVVPQSNDVVITWATGGGPTNVVQATGGDVNGGYSANFNDISGPVAIPGSGDTTNNYRDVGGATNVPSRFYRIRLGP
jgi:pectate lyase